MSEYLIMREGKEVGAMEVSTSGVSITGRMDTQMMCRLVSSLEPVPGTIWSRNGVLVVELFKPINTPPRSSD